MSVIVAGTEVPELLPIVVDLDGSLLKSDLLFEGASRLVSRRPWLVFKLGWWAAQGAATLKARLALQVPLSVDVMPYNVELILWLRKRAAHGHQVVLATASSKDLARRVAEHLSIFSRIFASDDTDNLKGSRKRDVLCSAYGAYGFIYVGNSWADLPVWQRAAEAVVVNGSAPLMRAVRAFGRPTRLFAPTGRGAAYELLRAMRIPQWIKNVLVLVPMFAAHRYAENRDVFLALRAALAFCLVSSSVYVLNDIVDLEDDRRHPRKRARPLASGALGLLQGWMAWPIVLAAGLALGAFGVGHSFVGILGLYFLTSLAYTLRLKQTAMIDVLLLAALYTLRLVAGAVAIDVPTSFWLLTFSFFIFVSLAFVKRFTEIQSTSKEGGHEIGGRGYNATDLSLVATMGGASGYVAVLVLALYINDPRTAELYQHPQVIWLTCPVVMYWISRIWLQAHRGGLGDDPIVFARQDGFSLVAAAILATVFLLAR